jgi:hypothetical protein
MSSISQSAAQCQKQNGTFRGASGAPQAGRSRIARCYGVPGDLPHGEALGHAAGPSAGSALAPATPMAQRGAGGRSLAR